MDNKLKDMPLIDLHLHIDGAIGVEKAYEIIKRDNIDIGKKIDSVEDLRKELTVSEDCQNLNEFLEKFEVPLKLMQTKEHIEEIVEDLVIRLARDKVIYAELRFAPQQHTKEGLSMEEVVLSAIEGIKKGMKAADSIKVKLLLCLMRNGSFVDNNDTINIASKYLDKGVCGVDLAGAEALYKTSDYGEFFEYAKEKGVPFTIHAGEADGPDSIKAAVDFGTARIGHGTTLILDEELMSEVKNKSILLEVCPTSNIKTKAVQSITGHPVFEYIKKGLNVCICTDDMTVQGSTLRDDIKLLMDNFGLTYEDIIKLNLNAVKSSFMDEKDKLTYARIIQTYLN